MGKGLCAGHHNGFVGDKGDEVGGVRTMLW